MFKRNKPKPVCELIDIQRNGRMITFTFRRDQDVFTAEMIGSWGDDVEGWRKRAGLE